MCCSQYHSSWTWGFASTFFLYLQVAWNLSRLPEYTIILFIVSVNTPHWCFMNAISSLLLYLLNLHLLPEGLLNILVEQEIDYWLIDGLTVPSVLRRAAFIVRQTSKSFVLFLSIHITSHVK